MRMNFSGASSFKSMRRFGQRTGCVGHVIEDDRDLALHITDDIHDLQLVRARPPFVDDGQIGIVQTLGERSRPDHTANIRRHNDHVLAILVPRIA